MKSRFLLLLALVMGVALLPRGAAAQLTTVLDPSIFGGGCAHDVAVDAGSNRVYVTATYPVNTPRVAVIDGDSNTVIATVPVGGSPRGVAVNPTTSRVYVTGRDSASVTAIDGTTNTVMATIPVGLMPQGVAVNPTTNLIYVANWASGDVSVIDGGTNTVVATIAASDWYWPYGGPYGVAVNPATNRIYVTNGTLSVIDGGSNAVVATIPVGLSFMDVAVNPATNLIYVGNSVNPDHSVSVVSVIDGVTNTVVATIPMGMRPTDVAVNPTTNHVFVAGPGNVAVIDGATNSILYGLGTGNAVAVNPVTGVVYVVFEAIEMCGVNVTYDSPGAPPPPAPSPAPLPAPTPPPCPPAPAPPLADGMEWAALQCGTCNPVATTYPDNTPVGTVAGAVAPPEALEALWRFDGAEWTGYSTVSPAASDLTHMDFLDVVFVCVEGAATFTRPVP